MAKEKACLSCRTIYSGDKCPSCESTNYSDSFKGKVFIFNGEKSAMAHNMKINKNGQFAIKTK